MQLIVFINTGKTKVLTLLNSRYHIVQALAKENLVKFGKSLVVRYILPSKS